MQYRDFRYSNEFGQVDLKRGSLVGIGLSWLLVKALQLSLLGVTAGTLYSGYKYFVQSSVEPVAVAAPVLPVMDYAGHNSQPAAYQPARPPRVPATAQHLPAPHKVSNASIPGRQ